MTSPCDGGFAGSESGPRGRLLRTFGRRRARRLTARQSELLEAGLPAVMLDLEAPPPSSASALLAGVFPRPVRACWLEIGFGGGEHLLWQARHHRDVGFIACEPFIDGVVKVVDGARELGLDNIRLHADDARDVLPWLPPASIERAFVLFPDPWPKARHHKRRLVDLGFAAEMARIVAPGGELRLATDIADYARQMLLAIRAGQGFTWMARRPRDWRERPDGWPETRYEQKAVRAGRKRYFLRFRRRA